jgi:hypothetical protein
MKAVYRSLVLTTLLCSIVGCQSFSRQDDPTLRVDAIRLVTTPSAQNFDDKPGADGFLVKVYALSHASPKAIPFSEGALELALYKGVYPDLVPNDVAPLTTWRYEAKELSAFAARSYVGVAYTLIVRWDDGPPIQGGVTLVARFFASGDRVLTATPVSHTLGTR